jgi:hypothetical protein
MLLRVLNRSPVRLTAALTIAPVVMNSRQDFETRANADRSPRGRKFKARNNAHFSMVLFVSSEANAGDVESTALRVLMVAELNVKCECEMVRK